MIYVKKINNRLVPICRYLIIKCSSSANSDPDIGYRLDADPGLFPSRPPQATRNVEGLGRRCQGAVDCNSHDTHLVSLITKMALCGLTLSRP
jgi:hypothetical protein